MKFQYEGLSKQYSNKKDGYYELERAEILSFIPEEARFVLDVGCSAGGFGRLIKKNRPETSVWGVEPSKEAAETASEKLDKVVCGLFGKSVPGLEGQKFDCIIFNDVLEHMVNPEEALIDAKDYLSEKGLIIASIPNILYWPTIYQVLRYQDWKYEDSGILDNTHLRFYTKRSIIRMVEECGFNVEDITGINPFVTKKYRILNFLLMDHLSDWKYLQFVIRAKNVNS